LVHLNKTKGVYSSSTASSIWHRCSTNALWEVLMECSISSNPWTRWSINPLWTATAVVEAMHYLQHHWLHCRTWWTARC